MCNVLWIVSLPSCAVQTSGFYPSYHGLYETDPFFIAQGTKALAHAGVIAWVERVYVPSFCPFRVQACQRDQAVSYITVDIRCGQTPDLRDLLYCFVSAPGFSTWSQAQYGSLRWGVGGGGQSQMQNTGIAISQFPTVPPSAPHAGAF